MNFELIHSKGDWGGLLLGLGIRRDANLKGNLSLFFGVEGRQIRWVAWQSAKS